MQFFNTKFNSDIVEGSEEFSDDKHWHIVKSKFSILFNMDENEKNKKISCIILCNITLFDETEIINFYLKFK